MLLLDRLDNWFGQPAPPERLAMFRILTGLFALVYLGVRLPVLIELSDGRPSRFEPVGLLSVLTGPLPSGIVLTLVVGSMVAAVAFVAGWQFRITGPALGMLLLLLGTYRSSWGQILHFENLLVLHVLIVGFSRSADAWASDARHHWRWAATSSRYGWPLRVAAVVTVVTYVLAGLAKLRYGGIDWMLGDTLRNHIAYSAARLDLLGGTPSPVAGVVVPHGWLFPPLAVATVVIELAAPIALLGGLYRRWWVLAAWLMHAGILGLMFVVFPYPLALIAFAPLYELERLAPSRRGALGPMPQGVAGA